MKNIILIVDDEPSARISITAMLEGRDYQLEFATNGIEAIQMAQEKLPDLILLDVMMPGLDGFEVCSRLRNIPKIREIPILILTALDDRESFLRGLNAGADDFLTKPLDQHEFRARVATITRLNRYRILVEQRENLKDMARRVIQAQEQERLHISRELHDDFGQMLIFHKLQLQFVLDNLSIDQMGLRAVVTELVEETSNSFLKLRLLAQQLRPPLLSTLGVTQALRAYCDDFSRRSALPTHYEAEGDAREVPDTICVILYRVLQESLSNVLQHASARQVWVSFSSDDEEVSLTVQDDGKGMLVYDSFGKGLGLQGMQERVTLTGGVFNVRSSEGDGTVVAVRFLRDEMKED